MRKEKPILFSTMMVQALLSGRKTMTRRVIKEPDTLKILNSLENDFPKVDVPDIIKLWLKGNGRDRHAIIESYYGQMGDWLWVRENWQYSHDLVGKSIMHEPQSSDIVYQADEPPKSMMLEEKWHPSIHLKKDQSRIWLRITDIKIERLMSISAEDAKAEGVLMLENWKYAGFYKNYNEINPLPNPIASFFSLWDSINGSESLKNNPWVWAITFEVKSRDQKEAITELEAVKA